MNEDIWFGIVIHCVVFVVAFKIDNTCPAVDVEELDGNLNFCGVDEPIESLITKSVIVVGVPDTFVIKVLLVLS